MLFLMVQETGRDACFRCGAKIADVDDLTFDHKMPWIDESVDLFWDLGNVAFSHSLCNSLSRRTIAANKMVQSIRGKVGPTGTTWCSGHSRFLPTAESSEVGRSGVDCKAAVARAQWIRRC